MKLITVLLIDAGPIERMPFAFEHQKAIRYKLKPPIAADLLTAVPTWERYPDTSRPSPTETLSASAWLVCTYRCIHPSIQQKLYTKLRAPRRMTNKPESSKVDV